jgi:hypothetical protein
VRQQQWRRQGASWTSLGISSATTIVTATRGLLRVCICSWVCPVVMNTTLDHIRKPWYSQIHLVHKHCRYVSCSTCRLYPAHFRIDKPSHSAEAQPERLESLRRHATVQTMSLIATLQPQQRDHSYIHSVGTTWKYVVSKRRPSSGL